jgi:glucose-1-phosphate adenylyltransferase
MYESAEQAKLHAKAGQPRMGNGDGSAIERAILDKNCRLRRNVRIVNEANVRRADGDGYCIRDGIVVIEKDAVIAPGTVI